MTFSDKSALRFVGGVLVGVTPGEDTTWDPN